MTIVTIGIDLAKNVFAAHGVDATGKAVLVRPSVARAKLLELIAALPPCLIGMNRTSHRVSGLVFNVKSLHRQDKAACHLDELAMCQ